MTAAILNLTPEAIRIPVRIKAPQFVDFRHLARQIVKVDNIEGMETDFRYAMAQVREYAELGLLDELVEQYYANTPAIQLSELIDMGVA